MNCPLCDKPGYVAAINNGQLSIDQIDSRWRAAIVQADIAPLPKVTMPTWCWANLYDTAKRQIENRESKCTGLTN